MPTETKPKREDFLGDVVCGAVEGGTGYWAQVSAYQWLSTHGELVRAVGPEPTVSGTRAVLHELDDGGDGYREEGLILDSAAVERGIDLVKNPQTNINSRLRETILAADAANDCGEIDADGADAIAQLALLGEVRYG